MKVTLLVTDTNLPRGLLKIHIRGKIINILLYSMNNLCQKEQHMYQFNHLVQEPNHISNLTRSYIVK